MAGVRHLTATSRQTTSPTGALLACVDRSRYASAVCDYAAWFSGRTQSPIVLVNVDEPGKPNSEKTSEASPILRARERLEHEGAEAITTLEPVGRFARTLIDLSASAEMILMGKRGREADDRSALGSNVEPVVRGTTRPVCLVSQVYLPISRALIILDADPLHRRAVNFVSAHPALRGLEMDLVLMDDGLPGAASKLTWAREQLRPHSAGVFAMSAATPAAAVRAYRRNGGFDLLIISREVALADKSASLKQIDPQSIWAQRAPVLIC